MRDYFDEHDNFNPECPEHRPFCPEDHPDMPPFCPDDHRDHRRVRPPHMPSVPSVVSGMDLYEAMNNLTGRVNTCIESYNAVMAENYKTLHNLQRAAEENGAYYDPDSVFVEEGYYADESATYHLIHKRCVDRRGEPIRMQLHLAYGNTTNSKIEQSMFAASKVEYADKMIVAIPKTDKGWYGKAIYHGCPIASADEPELYTVGFTKSGVMRVYNNGANIDQMLRDTVVDAMGCSGVLIQNGQITDDSYRKNIPSATEQVSRVVMGQVGATKEVVILAVGNENDVNRKGMTSLACANVLKQYGCDIAVELCEGAGSGAMDKGSLMYVPDGNEEPKAYAYWFISRKCFYRNDYERELAELVQNYGACIWQGFLNKKSIEKVKTELDAEIERAKTEEARLDGKIDAETDRATEAERVLQENIDKETERATEAERVLQENIDKETERATEAERVLQENIDKETARAEAEEDRLDKKIDAETERATEAERVLQENIDKETARATEAERVLQENIDKETERATEAERVLQENIDKETARAETEEDRLDKKIDAETERAEAAEQKLTEDLDAEVHRATNAEAILHQEILTEQGERIAADKVLQTNINTEASTRADADSQLQANIDSEASARADADSQLQVNIDAEASTRQSEDNALRQLISDEATRAKAEESRLDEKIESETTRAKNAESVLQSNIDKEVERAKAAEGVLQQNIDAETKRATGAETKLASDIDAEVHARETADTNLHTEITTVDGKLTALTSRVDECESDIANLQAVTTALQQQMSALDKTVAGMLQTVSDVESAMNDVKLAVNNMQTLVNNLSAQFTELKTVVEGLGERITDLEGDVANIESDIADIVDGTTVLPYVKKSGDSMTGALKIQGATLQSDPNGAFNIIPGAGGNAIWINAEVFSVASRQVKSVTPGTEYNDAVVVEQLNAEINRATEKENTLQSAITAEANRAESAEAEIKSSYVKKSGDTMSGALLMKAPISLYSGNEQKGTIVTHSDGITFTNNSIATGLTLEDDKIVVGQVVGDGLTVNPSDSTILHHYTAGSLTGKVAISDSMIEIGVQYSYEPLKTTYILIRPDEFNIRYKDPENGDRTIFNLSPDYLILGNQRVTNASEAINDNDLPTLGQVKALIAASK